MLWLQISNGSFMHESQAIPNFRINALNSALSILENSDCDRDPKVVETARETLRNLLLNLASSEIYTETPLATIIEGSLVRERVRHALSQPEPQQITTIFRYVDKDERCRFVSIVDPELTSHATIKEVVERVALEIGTMGSVELILPGMQRDIILPKEMLTRRFCDVPDLSNQALLSFLINDHCLLGR